MSSALRQGIRGGRRAAALVPDLSRGAQATKAVQPMVQEGSFRGIYSPPPQTVAPPPGGKAPSQKAAYYSPSYFPSNGAPFEVPSVLPTQEPPPRGTTPAVGPSSSSSSSSPPAIPMQYDSIGDKLQSILQRIHEGTPVDQSDVLDLARRGLSQSFFFLQSQMLGRQTVGPEERRHSMEQLLVQRDAGAALDYYRALRSEKLLTVSCVELFLDYQLQSGNTELAQQTLLDFESFKHSPPEESVRSFFALCLRSRDYASAWAVFRRRAELSIAPTTEMFSSLFDLARSSGTPGEVAQLLESFESSRVKPSEALYRNLITLYLREESVERAESVLESLWPSSSVSPSSSSVFPVTDFVYSPLCDVYFENHRSESLAALMSRLYENGQDLSPFYLARLPELFSSGAERLLELLDRQREHSMIPNPLFFKALFQSASSSGPGVWERVFPLFLSLVSGGYPYLSSQHFSSILEPAIQQQRWDAVQQIIHLYEGFPGSQSDLSPWETILQSCKRCEKAMLYYGRLRELGVAPSSSILQNLYVLGQQSRNASLLQSLVDEWWDSEQGEQRRRGRRSRLEGESAAASSSSDSVWLSTVLSHGVETADARSEEWMALVRLAPPSAETTLSLLSYYRWKDRSWDVQELLESSLQHPYSANQFSSILEICKQYHLNELGLRYYSLLRNQSLPQTKSIVSNVFSFFRERDDWDGALSYFQDRKQEDGRNNHLYFSMMSLCKAQQAWPFAKSLIEDLLENGIKPSNSIQSSVLGLYRECKQFEEAGTLYEALKLQGKVAPVVHGCMIGILGDQERFEEAMDLYRGIRSSKEEVGNSTFCALFHNCAKERSFERAMVLYDDFQHLGIEHNTHIYSSLMLVCAETSHWETVESLQREMEARGVVADEYVREILNRKDKALEEIRSQASL